MLSSLAVITPPTVRRFMAPETVLGKLGLTSDALDDVSDLVDAASGLVAAYLRFEPFYGIYEEVFSDVRGPQVYLGARPAWAISSLKDQAGSEIAATTVRLVRGPLGESSVFRPIGWIQGRPPLETIGGYSLFPPLASLVGYTAAPDWTIRYPAGWYVEEMGEAPPGVDSFPPALIRDFMGICRWMLATEKLNPLIYTMRNEGAEIQFLHRKDQDIDDESGIPTQFLLSLSRYRRTRI